MRRILIVASVALVGMAVLAVAGMWAVSKGVSPLVDGARLQDGRVTVVVDRTSPMPVAAYILKLRDGGLALVDATMDPDARALRAALRRLGRSALDVQAILCTHAHDDHTAGRKSFPNATVYIMRSARGAGGEAGAGARDGVRSVSPDTSGVTPRRAGRVVRLQDGETLDLGGERVEVFALPGHTHDSAAYLVGGVLFLGDSAAGLRDDKIGPAPPFVSVDRKLNQSGLKRLARRLQGRGSEIRYLAFGHQGPVKGLEPLLAWAESR